MFKNVFLIVFIWFLICPQSFAKDFKINYEEKLRYVNMDFWTKLGDENLCCYIVSAVKNNHDARKASYQVEQFRQKTKVSLGKELPYIAVYPAYLGAQVPKLDNFELSTNAFILPFILTYEADFLLKNRDKTKSENKNYEIEKYREKAVYIALASDVAALYVNAMKFDKMLDVNEKILVNQKELLRKTKLRYDSGISTKTELNNAEQNILDLENNITEIRKNRRDALFELAVMIGENPDCINDLKLADIDDFGKNFEPPECISSDAIFSRPDIMAAEANLEKAKIDIRVARKEFLPRFNITGVWIFNTIAPGTFFSWEASLASIMAAAGQDIFTGGRKIANLKIKKLEYERLFEEYKQTDLTAIKEVSAVLCKINDDTSIYKTVYKKSVSENDNYKLTNLRYHEGTASQMDILTNENKIHNISQVIIDKQAQKFIDYISLYKAVGGKL